MSLKRDEDYELPAKKPRLSDAEFDDIDPLALDTLLAFLDVKSLFRFAFSSKRFGQIVTHEHVVRSALISGGHAKKTIAEVIELALKLKTIYLPTPLRLLRLANGKTCETQSCSALVNHIRHGYGLFCCWGCLVDRTMAITTMKHRMLKNERVARSEYSRKAYVLQRPYTDTTGERAGPIVSAAEKENEQRIDTLLKEADDMWPQARTDSVLQCLEQATEDRKEIEERTRDRKKKRLDGKKAKAKEVAEKLKELVSEDCPFKDTLCSYKEFLYVSKQNQPSIGFDCQFMDDQMKPLVVAPSKATKKKLTELAEYVKETAIVLQASGFLDFSFLEGDKEMNPWESALRGLLRDKIQPTVALELIDQSMLKEILEGNLFAALKRFENDYTRYHRPNGNWAGVFVDIIMSNFADDIPSSLADKNARALADIIYIDIRSTEEDSTDFTRRCSEAAEKFRTLLPIAEEFADHIKDKARAANPTDEARQEEYVIQIMPFLYDLTFIRRLEKHEFESLFDELIACYRARLWR
jgi:hypothetical protein